MFTVINILNPLTGGRSEHQYQWEKGKPLSHYLQFDDECMVGCNNQVIDKPLGEIYPARGETYMFLPRVAHMDRQSWRLVGYATMTAVSFIPGWGPAAAFVGSNLINLYLQDKPKSIDTSQTYSWQHTSSPTAAHGTPMPIIYGKTRVRPTLKNRYVTVDGDEQRLYALYGVAAHKLDVRTLPEYELGGGNYEVQFSEMPGATFINRRFMLEMFAGAFGIDVFSLFRDDGSLGIGWEIGHGTASFADDVYINGKAIGDYDDDVQWETRPGLPEQSVITGFNATYVNYTQDDSLFLDYPSIERTVAGFGTSSIPPRVYWNAHTLYLRGTAYTIKAGNLTLTPSDIGYTTYIYYDPDASTTTYRTWTQSAEPPPTGYPIFSFVYSAGSPTFDEKTYYEASELPVADDWVTPLESVTGIHNVELFIEFPYGLYQTPSGEGIKSAEARIFAQYREVGTETWYNFEAGFSDPDHAYLDVTTQGIAAGGPAGLLVVCVKRKKPQAFTISLKAVDADSGVLLDAGKEYEFRVAAIAPSIIMLTNVATIVYGEDNADGSWPGFTYPGEPLVGIKALASAQVNSDIDLQVDAERSDVWVYNTRYSATYTGTDVRFLAEDDQFGTLSHINQTTVPVEGGWFGDIFWPMAQVTIRGADSNNITAWVLEVGHDYLTLLNDDVTTEAPGAEVTITMTGKWVTGDANNHAWAVYDMLVHGNEKHKAYPHAGNEYAEAMYGDARDPVTGVDYESFRTWAENITSIGYQLNICFDTFMSVWDAILRVCQEGRGMVYPIGMKMYAFTDKAASVSQLFTYGNIIEGSFSQKYVESSNKVNMIEADYWDADRSYERTSLALRTSDWDSGSRMSVSTKVTLYGTTSFEQAYSIIRFILYCNELLNDAITFEVEVDALAAQAGQVVEVQHPIFNTGVGGRIVSYNAANKWITLDREVTIVPGTTYELAVYHSNGTTERHTFTAQSPHVTSIIATPYGWSVDPAQYEPYSFGVYGTHTHKYRIVDISRSNEQRRKLTLVAYDPDIYESYLPSDIAKAAAEGEYTDPSVPVAKTTTQGVSNLLNLASNVRLREVVTKNRVSGEYESDVVVLWETATGDPKGTWEIWFRDVDASDVDWQGTYDAEQTYSLGDKVEYDGITYVSTSEDNTEEPS